MFNTGKNINKADIPFADLAMLYLRFNHGGLSTPEDYLVQFIQVCETMEKRFDEEPRPSVQISPAIANQTTRNHYPF